MRITAKILKILIVLIITVSIILFSASIILQDKVAEIFLSYLNKDISTKLSIGSFKLSFLKKFPKASLELRDVLINSSSDFNSEAFKEINTDTLLAARFISAEFKIIDILKGNYEITSIGAREGLLNIFVDSSGYVNYNISSKNKKSDADFLTIDIKIIDLKDIRTNYANLATSLFINGLAKKGKLKSKISGNNLDFTSKAVIQIDSIQLNDTKIIKTISADIDFSLQKTGDSLLFKRGSLKIENYNFGMEGFISPEHIADLKLTGNNIDISRIRTYLPEKYFKLVSEYDPSGILTVDCRISGLINRTTNPHIEINSLLKNGHISYGNSNLSINDLSFAGYFTNGSGNHQGTSSLLINNFNAKLGSAQYTGSFYLSSFENYWTRFSLKGKIVPAELKEFFDLKNISTADGYADADINMSLNLTRLSNYSITDYINLKPKVNLSFNSLSIGYKNDKMLFTGVNGKMKISDYIQANELQLSYKGQEIKVNGKFTNLPEWLTGRAVIMTASADITFSRLIPAVFKKEMPSENSTNKDKEGFSLPGDLLLDINFRIDSLTYKSISSSNITGSLNYKPNILTVKSMNMNSLNGTISGNGFIVQNKNKSVITRANINVAKIDVNKTFSTFKNFGQNFLKAENIAGALTGSFSIFLPMDSMLKPQINLLTAEGKYLLNNGALINFDPIKRLSSFIEISELENISFQQLENDFFIKNNYLYIPHMDVRSSAADLNINGKHSFNNEYEYHIKILLSEILSKKRKKNRKNVTEFGMVEDDGLGRTSLLLKIETKGKMVKVGYDIKAAAAEVKENIKAEKKTLKSILNQEYGWYDNDSTLKQKPKERTRFRINWDENDSIKESSEPPEEKKESVIKGLFKRR
jgi:AsmA-like C-terminal region